MNITPDLRDLILQRASAIEIKRVAVAGGMLTLRRDALMKLRRGVTSVEEVLEETAGRQAVTARGGRTSWPS
jgi:type II secretory ATPase GspE/PulE/Tfp pilus assembly ATPase PilB-like protein